jgi:hypothetical protein
MCLTLHGIISFGKHCYIKTGIKQVIKLCVKFKTGKLRNIQYLVQIVFPGVIFKTGISRNSKHILCKMNYDLARSCWLLKYIVVVSKNHKAVAFIKFYFLI